MIIRIDFDYVRLWLWLRLWFRNRIRIMIMIRIGIRIMIMLVNETVIMIWIAIVIVFVIAIMIVIVSWLWSLLTVSTMAMDYYNYDCHYDCHYNFNFAYYVKLVAFKSFSSSHPFSELCSEMHQRREASIKFMPGSLLLYQWENPKLLQSTETLHIYDRGWTNTLCGNRTTGLNGKCVSPGVSSYNKYASEAFQYRNSSERPISTMASMVIDSQCNFSLNI